ncbi:MAG: diacylglycerol/lipid kinase family protein [Geminicoccaceae bacterium]
MTKIGVISNPKSQYNRQAGLAPIEEVVADHAQLTHEPLFDFATLDEIIERFIRDDVEVIAVNGGDGTVQAVLTALARREDGECPPKLAILQGGMTNVIAKDVGMGGHPAKALAQLSRRIIDDNEGQETSIEHVSRPLIGLVTNGRKPTVYGMFFGAAGFHQAVLLAQENVRPKGLAGNLASASSLVLILARLLVGRPGADNPLYRGEAMAIGLDGRRMMPESPYLLLIATTLDRLMLGLMPFWGETDKSIRYTSVAFPPERLALALLPVLRGKPRPWMLERGYRSGTVCNMAIDIKSPVVLDGEIYHPEPDCPIRLTGDREATFLRC